MHDAHTQHFKVVAIQYVYSTSFPSVFTYMCILIALRSSKTLCFELRPAHVLLASVLKFWWTCLWSYAFNHASRALFLLTCMCFRYGVNENLRETCYFNPPPPSTLTLLDGVTPITIFKVFIYDFRSWVSQHVSCTRLFPLYYMSFPSFFPCFLWGRK